MNEEDQKDPLEESRKKLRELDERMDHRTGELIDANAKMAQICRKMARDMTQVALAYESLAEVARNLSEMCAECAVATADLTGDIIKSEWQLSDEDDDLDDDDEDDDDD